MDSFFIFIKLQFNCVSPNDKDFNYKIIDYLKTETPFKEVSQELFRDAVKTWKKNNYNGSKPAAHENPFAFTLYHALKILGYPETKFSTIKLYYGHGKKLFENNDLG